MTKFNPNNYKNLQDDSAMIQAAIDEAAKTGETVLIPRHNERTNSEIWDIKRAIKLHSGSVVCLDNCHLRQADGMMENMFMNSNNETDFGYTREGRQYDIKVYGLGNAVLDGGVHNGLREHNHSRDGRPHIDHNSMFNFVNVERLAVDNVRIINHRYWGFVHHYCSHGRISNIDFYVPLSGLNQDGINLRSGCSHFTIENITGCTGDDTVAMTNLRNRHDEHFTACGYDTSIHNVIVRNIRSKTKYGIVRILNHYGKKVFNIIIENIVEDCESEYSNMPGYQPIHPEVDELRVGAAVRIGGNAYCEDESLMANIGDTYNVTVRSVMAQCRMAVKVDRALNGGVFEDLRMYGRGGTAVHFGEGRVENVVIKDVVYPMNLVTDATDDNRSEGPWNGKTNLEIIPDRELCAIYFKETKAKNIIVQNVIASDKLTSVFGGDGDAEVIAANIITQSDKTPINTGKDIKIKSSN
ncbi:MAG: hypothetical protein WCX81_07525 [Monoglobales bacterium]